MNYVKRNFSPPKTVVLGSVQASPQKSRSWTISYRAVAPLAMACDTLIIFTMSILSGVAYHLEAIGMTGSLAQFSGFAAVAAALFISLAHGQNLYNVSELLNFKAQSRRLAITWAAVFLFLTAAGFVMKLGESFSRGATIAFAFSGLAALIAARGAWRFYLADGLAVRRFSSRRIALIAEEDSQDTHGLVEALTRHGLQLAHQFLLPATRNSVRRRAVIAQAISSIRHSKIEEIVVSADLDRWAELEGLLSELRVLPLPVNLIPIGAVAELFKLPSHTIGDTVTIELQAGPRTLLQRMAKRVLDIAVATIALMLLLPLMLITAIAIALDSRGPILFRQTRRGFNGRPFRILKFRTMSVLEDGDNVIQVRPNDPRVTRLGDWLRRTSIDELPQLLNVLRGDMSIVGPRPHAVVHDDEFDRIVAKYAYRHHVKPGLTGWAQVNGHRGQTRTLADIEQRVKFDLWYIDNWNFGVDFKIMFMTAAEIMRGNNAY